MRIAVVKCKQKSILKGRALDRLTNDMCLCFFLSSYRTLFGMPTSQSSSSTAVKIATTEYGIRKAAKENVITKSSFIEDLETMFSIPSFSMKELYLWILIDNEINEHLQTFSIYFMHSAKIQTLNHLTDEMWERERKRRKTFCHVCDEPDHQIMPILQYQTITQITKSKSENCQI